MSIRLDTIKDPKLRQRIEEALGDAPPLKQTAIQQADRKVPFQFRSRPSHLRLNKTEQRWCDVLEGRGYKVMRQAITLRLDPPFTSYRPDLAVFEEGQLVLWEVKAKHRFARAGIAKTACASKTYPCFKFKLALWDNSKGWLESEFSS